MNRPKFCEIAQCSRWAGDRCKIDQLVCDNYFGIGSVGRKKAERKRLKADAEDDPNRILQKCAEI